MTFPDKLNTIQIDLDVIANRLRFLHLDVDPVAYPNATDAINDAVENVVAAVDALADADDLADEEDGS